jgi:ribosome-binding factor A
MANFNIKRLNEDIKREISAAVGGVKDPRVSKNFVTVTHCEVTNDLSYCKVMIACMGGEGRTAKAVEGMTAAAGYFKKCIASRIRVRKIPELIFLPDNSLEYSAHIEEIISDWHKNDKNDASEDDGVVEDEENEVDEDED